MLTAALVIAGWISVYLLLRRMLQRSIEQLDSDLRDQLQALRNQLQPSRVALRNEPVPKPGSRYDRAPLLNEIEPGDNNQHDSEFSGIDSERISALRSTLSAFVGQEVRIRSVKRVPASNGFSSAWAREGRMLVQNSHDVELSKPRARLAVKPASGPPRNELRRRAA